MIEIDESDLIMARQLLCQEQEESMVHYLARLFAHARQGDLCIAEKGKLPFSLVEEVSERTLEVTAPLVRYQGRTYLHRNWKAETGFIQQWKRIEENKVEAFEGRSFLDETLLPEQREAILYALSHSLTLIVGGPGTGKSYTSRKLVEVLQKVAPNLEIALAAPTGKAASNLQGSLTLESGAKTLHALLYRKKRLSADVILVDESSMIDVELMHRLFSCLKKGARLVLVGDPDQLPPVEAGSLFADLVKSGSGVIRLKSCMRAENEGLITFAEGVRDGKLCQGIDPVTIASIPTAENLAKEAVWNWEEAIKEASTPKELLLLQNRWRLLSLMRKGKYGVDSLNKGCLKLAKRAVYPLLITKNDYQIELFNGEMGILMNGVAYFEGSCGVREIPEALLPQHELAYCLSVHKSQGSEFQKVTLVLPDGSEQFGREGLYTAITRSKREIKIYQEKGSLLKTLQEKRVRLSGVLETSPV